MSREEAEGSSGRALVSLLTASTTSNLADGAVKAALPLIAVRWTDSPVLVGGVLTALTLPWLLFALPAGLLVDTLDRRRSMIAANVFRASALAVLAAAISTGNEAVWPLYLAAFALGSAETVHDTAAQSILPGLVDTASLERANGRLTVAEVAGNTFVGPPLGGFLVAAGVVAGVAGPAALWVVAAAALLALPAVVRSPMADRGHWTHELRGGLRAVRANAMLRRMAVMVGIANLAVSAFLATFALHAVGPGSALKASDVEYGVLLAVAGAGSVVGAVGTARAARRLGRGRVLAACLLGMVVFVGTPSVAPTLAPLVGTFLVGGAAVSAWNVVTVSFRQRITPDHLLGRVNSVYRLVAWGTIPVGALLGGVVGDLVGLPAMFAVAAVIAALPLLGLVRVNETSMRRAEDDVSAGP